MLTRFCFSFISVLASLPRRLPLATEFRSARETLTWVLSAKASACRWARSCSVVSVSWARPNSIEVLGKLSFFVISKPGRVSCASSTLDLFTDPACTTPRTDGLNLALNSSCQPVLGGRYTWRGCEFLDESPAFEDHCLIVGSFNHQLASTPKRPWLQRLRVQHHLRPPRVLLRRRSLRADSVWLLIRSPL
jgi:hypothetical protein